MTQVPSMLDIDDRRLAYRRLPGRGPQIVFCTGFRSDMSGSKAVALEDHCRRNGQGFVRFDYSGHGLSNGRFEDGTIGAWTDDTLAILDHVATSPVILVGSSMGGWIMLLAALARPALVRGLVGIAPAPDFTEALIWRGATDEVRRRIMNDGVWQQPSDYSEEPTPITRKLIEDGRRHLLMDGPIAFDGPVHLLHGQKDPDVPWQTSLDLADRLTSREVTIELIKNGNHRLSGEADLGRMMQAVDRMVEVLIAT